MHTIFAGRTAVAAAALALGTTAQAQSIHLDTYTLVGTYALPIQAPGLTIQYEASAVAWNRSTNTLFIVGDGGRYIQQTSLTGVVIDAMALPLAVGASRAGVEFDDPEGLARALEKLAMGTARIAPVSAQPATASLYIANPFSGSGRSVLNLFSTHPAMELRISKLRAMRLGA